MNRMILRTSALALALAVVISGTPVVADDKDDKVVSIKKIMKDAHGKGGLRIKVLEGVKAKKWDDVEAAAKDWVKLAEALSKNKPPMGKVESWNKLTGNYEKSVKNLENGAEKKDPKVVNAELKRIGGSCASCHKSHKPAE